MENTLITVSDFIALTNQTLEYAYPTVAIEGEVSSFKVNSGKYVFFDLKDANSKVSCFMSLFQLRVAIEDGMKVIVVASPKLTNWGSFSLTVKSIKPSGEGAIKKSFELLKESLTKEGLFNEERKRALPYPPENLGVISSTQAAGYADFVKIINDRWGGVNIEVANVQVQGASAPDQIIAALEYFNGLETPPDVVAIIRGGGSADDLSTFNDEKLVRAIASSRTPTIVGVGHETDETLADLAADKRAATPSNAAQILVPDRADISRLVNSRMSLAADRMLSLIEKYMSENASYLVNVLGSLTTKIDTIQSELDYKKNLVSEYNPMKVLERGYALVRGKPLVGALIEVETKEKIIKAEVKEIHEK